MREQRREVEQLRKNADRLRKQRNTAEKERDDARKQLQQSQQKAATAVVEATQQQVMAAAERGSRAPSARLRPGPISIGVIGSPRSSHADRGLMTSFSWSLFFIRLVQRMHHHRHLEPTCLCHGAGTMMLRGTLRVHHHQHRAVKVRVGFLWTRMAVALEHRWFRGTRPNGCPTPAAEVTRGNDLSKFPQK